MHRSTVRCAGSSGTPRTGWSWRTYSSWRRWIRRCPATAGALRPAMSSGRLSQMSRKAIDTMRGHPGIPKKMRRSKKDSENVKKATPKAPVQDYHEVVFEEDGDGLFAMFGNKRMSLSPYGVQAGASVGETWRCMLDRNE